MRNLGTVPPRVDALSARLSELAARPLTAASREARCAWVGERFDRRDIARRTMAVYKAVVAGAKSRR